jgi:hypothetical protein
MALVSSIHKCNLNFLLPYSGISVNSSRDQYVLFPVAADTMGKYDETGLKCP